MRQWLLALVLMFCASVASAAEPLSVTQAADKLGKSVVAIVINGRVICTASKVGPAAFLTARHCIDSADKIQLANGRLLKMRSALVAFQAKDAPKGVRPSDWISGRDEDWAVIYTEEDDESVAALEPACGELVYLGQAVAYAGFPYPTQYALGLGNITTVKAVKGGMNNLDFGMNIPAAPGASGSPVISMDTGKVLGVLTEGIFGAHQQAFMVGFDSIDGTDLCLGKAGEGSASSILRGILDYDAMEK